MLRLCVLVVLAFAMVCNEARSAHGTARKRTGVQGAAYDAEYEAFSAPFIAASARQRDWSAYYTPPAPMYYDGISEWQRARIWARQYEYSQQRLWEQQRSDLIYWQLMQPRPRVTGR